MIDMHVNLGGLEMRSPVAVASGTFGYGTEYSGAVDFSKLGAVTAKGIRVSPWPGNPMPRHCEVPGGLVNAIGLQGAGAKQFLEMSVPWYSSRVKNAPPLIVNIWGGSIEEYAETAAMVDAASKTEKGAKIGAAELNVSCPNVKEGGHAFGQNPAVLERLVAAARSATSLPLIVKLAPNVPDVVPYVRACENGGADALSMINTIPAMVIDVEKRRSVLGNTTGGLSGRCVHPVAVKMVYDCRRATGLPILAMGGVYTATDALELIIAGANAVAVGTATFTDPSTAAKVYDGIADYLGRHSIASVAELSGSLET